MNYKCCKDSVEPYHYLHNRIFFFSEKYCWYRHKSNSAKCAVLQAD